MESFFQCLPHSGVAKSVGIARHGIASDVLAYRGLRGVLLNSHDEMVCDEKQVWTHLEESNLVTSFGYFNVSALEERYPGR